MSREPPTALATEAELQVARAEAEAQAAEVPSLEAGAAPKVVHIPVEGPALPRAPATLPDAPTASDAPSPAVATTPEPAPPRRFSPGRLVYLTTDGLLWALNRPFQRLSPQGRRLIGWLAIATLFTSLLALVLLPASR